MGEWYFDPAWKSWCKKLPTWAFGNRTEQGGTYTLWITARPPYCDLGDWMFYVESAGDAHLDFADGFPRYFFGTIEEAKTQMDTWVSRRKEIMK